MQKIVYMKVIICDVGDAACAFVTSNNGHTMMIDCGSNDQKDNPVDIFKLNKQWLGSKDYCSRNGSTYPITLLHITHPDDDHVRNASRVKKELTPYLLRKEPYEEYPDGDKINTDYVEKIDKAYRGTNPETINWSFEYNEICHIPVETCIKDPTLKEKIRNNSSIIRYIKEDGVGILFCGDLEKPGWEYLVANKPSFIKLLKENGVNILIAPHHGHKSGFPTALFNEIGKVDVVIHSKDTEASKEGTDVSSQYTNEAYGHFYNVIGNTKNYFFGSVLTTRSNGNIFIDSTATKTDYVIYAEKASPNHDKYQRY